jgi:hypothetical protein
MRRAFLSFSVITLFGALLPRLAQADNCGSLSDCYGTIAAGIAAAIAIAAIVAVIVFLPEILAALEIGAEAAAAEAAAAEAAAAEAAAAEAAATEAAAAEAAAAEAAAAEGAAAEGAAAEGTAAEGTTAAEGISAEASEAADAAVESAESDPNKVNHIFDNPTSDHQWGATGLDQAGNWGLIRDTIAQNFENLPASGVYEVTQTFEGFTVTVRGAIVDGAVRIGSAWVNLL